MAGYIGTKAVLLSTTAADVVGNAEIGGNLTVDTDTLFVDSTNNRVGFGTSSPDGRVDIAQAQNTTNQFTAPHLALTATGTTNTTGFTGISYASSDLTNYGWTVGSLRSTTGNNASFVFNAHNSSASGTERMRIDGSGNLLVGTTNSTPGVSDTDTGCSISGGGFLFASRDSGAAGYFNRNGSDGNVLQFNKNGTAIGSIVIGSGIRTMLNGYPISHSGGTGMGLGYGTVSGNPVFFPANGSYVPMDNICDLGYVSGRWDDIYATNGTIQTSDRNEKQDIDVLSEAETRVAQACKGLLRKFRWKDAVAEKGDDARIHFGIIAQDLQDAFAAEGLDAGRYAMFISSTWWEADEVIPAVEEVLDEEGNVVTEAQPERTVTHHYETAEEAPEGAVERTRLGVRYPELLAFIIGAM